MPSRGCGSAPPGGPIFTGPDFSLGQKPHGPSPAEEAIPQVLPARPTASLFLASSLSPRLSGPCWQRWTAPCTTCSGRKRGLGWGRTFQRRGRGLVVPEPQTLSVMAAAGRPGACPRALSQTVCQPTSHPQPAPNASPMKRSISTLAPQRPHVAHLCSAALDRAPASQAVAHHHHRCHRRRDRKQKSLEKGPSLSADTDGGACGDPSNGQRLRQGSETLFLSVPQPCKQP